jgi:hypothetical protein
VKKQMIKIGIPKVYELDFDTMIEAAGGKRHVYDTVTQKEKNADYEFSDAVVELKLIEEEGIEKIDRRRKIAALFNNDQNNKPVIVLDPDSLSESKKDSYYGLLRTPIQKAVKKAAQQVEFTRLRVNPDSCRVLIAINNGYTATSHDEFKDLVMKCAQNNTSKIDVVIVGGLYYFSDDWECIVLAPFEVYVINSDRKFHWFPKINEQWKLFSEKAINSVIQDSEPDSRSEKMAVADINFDIDSITYVKPAPRFGKPSNFWRRGRPRKNSTGITTCPPVAQTFPDLNSEDWGHFQNMFPDSPFFRESYAEWVQYREQTLSQNQNPIQPTVAIATSHKKMIEWIKGLNTLPKTSDQLIEYTNSIFNESIQNLIACARPVSEITIFPSRYVLVETHEIGQDMAFDFSLISIIQEKTKGNRCIKLIQNVRIFHEYALALAAAYALKNQIEIVLYDRIQEYVWN